MTAEQLLTIVLLLASALLGGLHWEVRALRKAKHRQAQHVQWCCMAIGVIARHLKIELPPPEIDE